MDRKTPVANDVARDNTALQQLIQDKFPSTDPIMLGDWEVGTGRFSSLQKGLPQGRKLCGVVVRVHSENGAVRVGGEIYSNVKTENVETGRHLKNEHFLLVVDAGNWCITLGRPTYRLILM
ncbi:hypothetical protein AOQ84DRAFT_226433 [Glonium stellatum]|uniref:Uncharacterized protein n=1 Tax=Glonium stellatum TaxID=574774 RepID=A0A8E2JZ55_9PEZI|nr:hypothetical protein AOQ84DRAFT_226433 [Glonium stellatum]